MKNLIITLVLILLSFSCYAREPKSLSPLEEASITFSDFIGCKESEKKLECVDRISSNNLDKRLKQKIVLWLNSVEINKDLETCLSSKLSLYPLASDNKYKIVRCFSYSQQKQNKMGIIYFLDESGLMKIDGIQFF